MTILCPIDFSAATPELVLYSAALAAGTQGELRLLHVLEPLPAPQPSDEWVATQLAGYHAVAEQAGARTSTAIRCGAPAAVILAEAHGWPASLLVIGAHGHSQLRRFLVSSTAEEVLRKASCATLVVKHGLGDSQRQAA